MRRSAVELADMVLKRAEDHYDQNLALIKQAPGRKKQPVTCGPVRGAS